MSDSTVSRRGFFGAAGTTAGALAALGSCGLLGAAAGTAQAAVGRTYTGFGLALEIDGKFAGFLTGASGGGPSAVQVMEELGASVQRNSLIAQQTPVSISFSTGIGVAAMEWMANPASQPRDVTILMYETATFTEIYRLSMSGVMCTAFSLSTLDAGSSELLEFTATLLAENSTHQFGAKGKLNVPAPKLKALRANNFRFFIDKLEASTQRARSVKGVSMTRPTAITSKGTSRFREAGTLIPAYPKFEAAIAMDGAPALYQWLGEAFSGKASDRPGQLQLMGPDGRPALIVDFIALLPLAASAPYDGGNAAVPAVKLELLPAEIRFNFKGMGA